MPSFWPWKGDDQSPAAFEKTLSDLSTRIGKATGNLETTRQRARRLKALWTLYTSFAYVLYVMIAALVVGYQNWGPVEYTAVSSTPVAIYLVRYGVTSYYDYRTSSQQKHLQSLQKQRDAAISRLKEATKYNTTQQLLEKYGGTPQKQAAKPKKEKSGGPQEDNLQNLRKRRETTGFVPPPTANIPGRRIVSASVPGSPQFPDPSQPQELPAPQPPQSAAAAVAPWRKEQGHQTTAGAEFAPNAFSEPRVYASSNEGPKWYDRLMDVVLGEDESNPKNRLALICQSCRLVNGQAPPGVKTLEDVGKWKCSACGEMNGEDTEARRIVAKIQAQADGTSSTPASPIVEEQEPDEEEIGESDHTVYSEDETSEQPDVDQKPAPKKRGRPKKSG